MIKTNSQIDNFLILRIKTEKNQRGQEVCGWKNPLEFFRRRPFFVEENREFVKKTDDFGGKNGNKIKKAGD